MDFGMKAKAIPTALRAGVFSVFERGWPWKPASQPCPGKGQDCLVQANSAHFFSTLQSVPSDWQLEISGSIYTIKIGNGYKSELSSPALIVRPLQVHHCLYSTPNVLPIPLTGTLTHHGVCKHIPCVSVYKQTHREPHIHAFSFLASLDWISAILLAVMMFSLVFF